MRIMFAALAATAMATATLSIPATALTAAGNTDTVSAWGHSCTRTTAKKAC